MEKKIVIVGSRLVDSDNILNLDFRSDRSLLDGDMIVFSVDISRYYGGENYQGLKCLGRIDI